MKIHASLAACAALAGVLALPAHAHDEKTEAAKPAAAPAADGLIVTRDATTGEMRAATAAEAASLQPKNLKNALTKVQMRTHVLSNGGVIQEASEDTTSYAMIRRKADGTLEKACVDGKQAAESFLKNEGTAQQDTEK